MAEPVIPTENDAAHAGDQSDEFTQEQVYPTTLPARALVWLSKLPIGSNTQFLRDHISNTDEWFLNRPMHVSSTTQVPELRKTFLNLLLNSPNPCGLPEKLPKCIAILNLSGEYRMFYSNDTSLGAMLALTGPYINLAESVSRVIQHAEQNEISVLCCLSLPWQGGVGNICWELRTLERRVDSAGRVEVLDNAMVASSSMECARGPVTPTMDTTHAARTPLMALEEFQEIFHAKDLDKEEEESPRQDCTGETDCKPSIKTTPVEVLLELQTLKKQCSKMETERAKLVGELTNAKHRIRKMEEEKQRDVLEHATAISTSVRKVSEENQAKMDRLLFETKEITLALVEAKAETEIVQKAMVADELVREEENAKLKKEIAAAKKEAASAEKARKSEMERSSRASAKNDAKLKKVQDVACDLQLDLEKKRQTLEMKTRTLTKQLGEQAQVISDLHEASSVSSSAFEKLQYKKKRASKTAVSCALWCHIMRHRHRADVTAAAAAASAAATELIMASQRTKVYTDASVNTEPLGASEYELELQAENVKIKNENESLKREISRIKKKPVPAQFLPVENNEIEKMADAIQAQLKALVLAAARDRS